MSVQFRTRLVAVLCVLLSLVAPLTAQGQFIGPMLGPEPCDIHDCETGRVMDTGQFFGYVGTLGRVLSTGTGEESLEGDRYWVWAEYLPGEYVAFHKTARTFAPWEESYENDPDTWAKYFVPGPTKELALAQGELADARVVSAQTIRDLWTLHAELEGEIEGPVPVDDELRASTALRATTTHVYLYTNESHPDGPVALEFPAAPSEAAVESLQAIQSLLVLRNGSVQFKSEGTITYLTDYFNRLPEDDDGGAPGSCSDRTFGAVTGPLGLPASPNLAGRFQNCHARKVGELLAPLGDASVTAVGYNPATMGPGAGHDWVDVQPNGFYQIYYKYPRNYFSSNPVYVKVPMAPFDDRRAAGVFTDTIMATYGGASWSSKWDPVGGFIPAVNNVNFPIRTAYLAGRARFMNVDWSDPPASDDDLLHYDFERADIAVQHGLSGQTVYDEAAPLVSPTDFQSVAPGVQRYDSLAADLHHRGLLTQISQADLLNTDTYIFAADSEGRVLPSQSDFYMFEKRGLFNNELFGFRSDGSGGFIFDPVPDPGGVFFARFEPRAFVPHPGSQYFKLYLINRVTGYMGSAQLKLVSRLKGDSTAATPEGGPSEGMVTLAPFYVNASGKEVTAVAGSAGSEWEMPLRPPNIKVTVTRANPRALENAEQTIGFEGAGLTGDTIQVNVDWRDHDGSPLPSGLPGFSGRLSVIGNDGNPTLNPATEGSQNNQSAAHFDISPGKHLELVRVPAEGANQHFYLHVHAVPTTRCTDGTAKPHEQYGVSAACLDFSGGTISSGTQGGALAYRPKNYVPIRVPIHDEAATVARLQAVADAIRAGQHGDVQNDPAARLLANQVDDGAGGFTYEAIKPVYKYVYRPELQFSLYELKEEETDATVITDLDAATGNSKTSLVFSTSIQGPGDDPLTSWGLDDRTLLWGVGFGEYLALTDGSVSRVQCTEERQAAGVCELDNLDRLAALTPSAQIGAVEDIASELTAADFLAIQLYSASDSGNVLYDVDLGHPLVSVQSKFIELERLHDLSRMDEGTWTDTYDVIDFSVNRPVIVTGQVLRPDGAPAGPGDLPFIQDERINKSGDYSFVVDYSTMIQFISDANAAADSTAPNFIIELEFIDAEKAALASAGALDGVVPRHIVRFPGRLQYRKLGEAIGQLVQHNVNVSDGSVRLERTDFSIPGAGPNLEFKRYYSNVSDDTSGKLGSGWSHNLDYRLVPMSKGFTDPGAAVPRWVALAAGKIRSRESVESEMLTEGEQQLGKLQVNGTVFTTDGTDWLASPGRYAQLHLEDRPCSEAAGVAEMAADDPSEPEFDLPGCFVFTARDGTSYYYDEPKMVLPSVVPSSGQATWLSLYDRLAYRVGFSDLALDVEPVNPLAGPEAKPWSATKVRLIRDRFGQTLTFEYEGETKEVERLRSVSDSGRGSSGSRTCEFFYTENPENPLDRLERVDCLEGADRISVSMSYDDKLYLETVSRGHVSETYGYEQQPNIDPSDEPCTAETNPDGEDNLSHCPFNLISITDEQENPPLQFKYFTGNEPELGLDAVDSRPYTEVVERVTYPPTTGSNPIAEIDFTYSDDSAGAVRTVSHMRSDIPASEYTLDHAGHPHVLVDSIDGSDQKETTQVWENGLVTSRTVEGPLQELTTDYTYEEGDIKTENTSGTSQSGDSISVQVTNTWETKPLASGGEVRVLRSRSENRNGVEFSESWNYDALGFLEEHTDKAGETWSYSPEGGFPGLVSSMTAPGQPALETSYVYDDYGNLYSTTVGSLLTTTARNSRGEIEELTNPREFATSFEYDDNGRVRFTRLPTGAEPGTSGARHSRILETTYEGRVKKTEQDRNGLVLTYAYTGRNQVERISRSEGGGARTFTYDSAGNLKSESDWMENVTTHEYNGLGYKISTTNREGDEMSVPSIDIFGNAWSEVDFEGDTTTATFDPLGRMTSVRRDCSTTTCGAVTTEYDADPFSDRGLYSKADADPVGVTHTDYDALGRVVAVTRVAGGRSSVRETFYDERGNEIETRDAVGQCTFRSYNESDQLEAILRAGKGCSESSGYLVRLERDGNGNVTDEWSWPLDESPVRGLTSGPNASATHVERTYDSWDRLTSESAPDAVHHEEIAGEAGGVNPQGVPAQFRYDGKGNLVSKSDHRGRAETWVRNARGLVQSHTDRSSASTSYSNYDNNGNVGSVTDARGKVTTITYDREDRPLLTTEGVGATNPIGGDSITRSTHVRAYDGMGRATDIVANGVTTYFTYDERGSVHRKRIEALDGALVETFTFDDAGRPKTQEALKNGTEYVRRYDYSSDERETTVTFSFSGEVQDFGQPSGSYVESSTRTNDIGQVEWVDERTRQGVTPRTTNTFDDFQRVIQVTRGNGASAGQVISTSVYNAADLVVETTDADTGDVTHFDYDKRGRLVRTQYPATSTGPVGVELRAYDENGNLRALKAPQGAGDSNYVTLWTYDESDRVTERVDPVGERTSWTYDAIGNRETETKPRDQGTGRVTRSEYDDLGRLVRITDRGTVSVTFDSYDARDNVLSQTIPGPSGGVNTSFTYDEFNNVRTQAEAAPDGSTVTSRFDDYDLFGNTDSVVDANGSAITYQHDHQGRRTLAQYPATTGEQLEYDRIVWNYEDDAGQLTVTEYKDGAEDTTVRQDDLVWLRPESITRTHDTGANSASVETLYFYHPDGTRHIVETTDTGLSGRTRYEYDARNRLSQTFAGGDAVTAYQYYADGRSRQVAYPNGLITSYDYNSARRVERIATAGGDQVVAVEYDYDLNGNRTAQREYRGGMLYVTSYGYDNIDRLFTSTFSSADGSPPLETTYGFEGYNRKTEQVRALTVPPTPVAAKTYDYTSGNHLERVSETVEDGGYEVVYAYDNNGNTESKTKDTGGEPEVTSFAFDTRNQLRAVRHQVGPAPPEVQGLYDYDANGYRVRARQTSRGAVDYYYDGSAVLEERTESGDLLARYHYDERALAVQDADAGDTLPKYYHQDGLGTTTHISDRDGSTAAEYMVDAWGRPRDMASLVEDRNRKLFTGHEYDTDTGLYYAKARYYDPDSGRFLSQDSYLGNSGMPSSLHRYMYAAGNPARYTDPTGHYITDGKQAEDGSYNSIDASAEVQDRYYQSRGTPEEADWKQIVEGPDAFKCTGPTGTDCRNLSHQDRESLRAKEQAKKKTVAEPEDGARKTDSVKRDTFGEPVLAPKEKRAVEERGVQARALDKFQSFVDFLVPYWAKGSADQLKPLEHLRPPPETGKRAQQIREQSGDAFDGAMFSIDAAMGVMSGGGTLADDGARLAGRIDPGDWRRMDDFDADQAYRLDGPVPSGGAGKGPVIIGETMTRVEAAAAKVPGAKILDDMPPYWDMSYVNHDDEVTSLMMQYNRKWILHQVRSGRRIVDIGNDPNRKLPSVFYEMEQRLLRQYKKLHPDLDYTPAPAPKPLPLPGGPSK